MKTKIITALCAVALLASTTGTVSAAEPGPGEIAVDTLIVRPFCLASTIVGSALFVVALPVAAISKSVKPTAKALVVKPARATFTRPLGDLEALSDY